jgi:arylsulfatase A-like enzyme
VTDIRVILTVLAGFATLAADSFASSPARQRRPNFVVIYTDDQRADALGFLNANVHSPNLDRLARRSVYFPNAFVVSALCSPSRAQLLTGRYSSQNGVAELPAEKAGDTRPRRTRFNPGEPLLAEILASAGYYTGVVGKWHIENSPATCGFQYARTVYGNGDYYDQTYKGEDDRPHPTRGHVEHATAAFAEEFLRDAKSGGRPFFLFYNTRVPHMDSRYEWPSHDANRRRHPPESFEPPATVKGSLIGKPPYLEHSRSRTQALHYGYGDPRRLQEHQNHYFSTIAELDAAIGTFIDALDAAGLREDTFIILMSDNGWFLGEHLFTSKVLAYEQSIRVPLLMSGPGFKPGTTDALALNIDIMPSVLDLASIPIPPKVFGRSLVGAARGVRSPNERDAFLYEMAPATDTARNPFIHALRTHDAKLIRTYKMGSETEIDFVELYDLKSDPDETRNLAADTRYAHFLATLNRRLDEEIAKVARGGQ